MQSTWVSGTSHDGFSAVVDGDYAVGWNSDHDGDGSCAQKHWGRINLNNRVDDTSVFVRRIRVHYDPTGLHGLVGAQILIGDHPPATMVQNTKAPQLPRLPTACAESLTLRIQDAHTPVCGFIMEALCQIRCSTPTPGLQHKTRKDSG